MKRRTFFKTSAFASPAVLMGCRMNENEASDPMIKKVEMAMLSMQRASWEQGVAAQAFLESGNKEMTIRMAYEAVLRQQEDGRLSVLYTGNGVTDPAASGQAVLYAAEKTGDEKLREASANMVSYLLTTEHRAENGTLHHIRSGPEIWIDAMYMAPPFLAAAGQYDEAIKQIDGFRKALWSEPSKLYSHRWNTEEKVFVNKKFWGVGNGWTLAGISRVIELLPAAYATQIQKLIGYEQEHLSSILSYMRSDGLYHDIIDDPSSFVETNLGQMIAYTIYTGVRAGWLDKNLIPEAEKMRSAARSKVDEYGYVTDVCGAPYFNAPGRATEGQAFFMLMEAARNK
ncbi:MAG: glycoside hydrolase family 88 protein [Bacteroidales bacterium]|nr:glycoside hydrolase family 88 protein [Bacteroidales bacterium]